MGAYAGWRWYRHSCSMWPHTLSRWLHQGQPCMLSEAGRQAGRQGGREGGKEEVLADLRRSTTLGVEKMYSTDHVYGLGKQSNGTG